MGGIQGDEILYNLVQCGVSGKGGKAVARSRAVGERDSTQRDFRMATDFEALIAAALERYFPDPGDRELAEILLEEYGDQVHHREALRVRAGLLKLAGSSLDRLEQQLRLADRDYRDVLAAAEFPRQMKEGVTARSDPDAHARCVQEDHAQYRNWVESFGLQP